MRSMLVISDNERSALNVFAKWASHAETMYCLHNITCEYYEPFTSEYRITYEVQNNDEV